MSRVETAKAYIGAVQTGDQGVLAQLISRDIVWYQPGRNRFSGTHHGLQAVGGMIGGMMERSEGTFTISKATHFMENGEWVAVMLEFTAQREGAQLAQPGVDLLRIVDGKILEARLFSGDQAQEDAFWGS